MAQNELVPIFRGEVRTGMSECAMLAATSDLDMTLVPTIMVRPGQKGYRFAEAHRNLATREQRARNEAVYAGKYIITVESGRVIECTVTDLSQVNTVDDIKGAPTDVCPPLGAD